MASTSSADTATGRCVAAPLPPSFRAGSAPKGMVWIPGGSFTMGSDDHYPEEAPAHRAAVGGFWMDRHPVTNAEFRRFVAATGYLTIAERPPPPGDFPGAPQENLVPGSVVFRPPPGRVDLRHPSWWDYLPGAHWRCPEGPGSTLAGRDRHPVVHIAYEDAVAYAAWAGKVLPTEAEWEFAARGGLDGAVYAWGDEFAPRGRPLANTWQGAFPTENLLIDGFAGTSPVGSFPPNGYGLFDMIGNTWEWTSDWYAARHEGGGGCCAGAGQDGGGREQSYDPQQPEIRIPRKVLKGGSFLCAPNYCRRYRPAARIAQQIDTGTCHQGFRCILRHAQGGA